MTRNPYPKKRQWGVSLEILAGLVIIVDGLIEGASLFWLRRMPESKVDREATARVTAQGAQFTRFIAGRSSVRDSASTEQDWARLHSLVSTFVTAQPGLQYVEVSRDGRLVFQHKANDVARFEGDQPIPPDLSFTEDSSPIDLSKTVLKTPDGDIPMLVFSHDFTARDGAEVHVAVALRRDAVNELTRQAGEGISAMFNIAIVATCISVAVCALIMLFAIRRDARRRRLRIRSEQLAFSGVLANGIVHDFRNPMSSVLLDAQMLERETNRAEGPRAERVAELASRIGRTVGRMDDVFKEFLYIAKPAPVSIRKIDLAPMVPECVDTLQPRFDAAGVSCRVLPVVTHDTRDGDTAKNGAPLFAVVSQMSFRRSLANIVLNALQFSPRGETVEIAMGCDRRKVWIEVRDRGPGIPSRDKERIFDIFETTRPGGTGLGLFFARTAMSQYGGTITPLDREGGGTVMRITLPAAD